ncbi:MAG: protein kinase [Gemmatimonadaceae bacterium]|nr:protein kinase [Gemmatimonadaceae bacterium]
MPRSGRGEFLENACAGDAALRRELESLLTAHDSAGEYFEDLGAKIVSPVYAAVGAASGSETSAALPAQLEAMLGGSYRIERELGGGAMSRVFLAEEIKLGRKVVIKVLPPELAASVSTDRFRREIQLAAQLQHSHIVPVFASDSGGSLLYYTMPFVAGESLQARLARDGALETRDAVRIWSDLLDALAYAHSRGVIHRDIKPANILVDERNALVTDFGIARALEAAAGGAAATATGLTIGTPAYMAPEQVMGDRDADHRVDIYAAGLVMYEMLEGRSPFKGETTREIMLARLGGEPNPVSRPDCPPELAALVLNCLKNDPAARPPSAEAVLARLESLPTNTQRFGDSQITASVSAVPHSRRNLAYGMGALALALIVFGATQLRRGPVERVLPAVREAPSIAVLPLTNLSADARGASLADGMTEELIAMISRTGNVRVIASTSVFALRGLKMDIRQIADTLRVSYLLEGGIQTAGSRLRMQIRLVEARDGSTRWSETYDRQLGDIFAIQDDVARAVARELDARLAVGGSSMASGGTVAPRRYTPNIVAYDWYLRGMNVLSHRSGDTPQQGLDYFNRAIAADSNFAAAYAGKAQMYGAQVGPTPGGQRAWLAKALQAARKAVALDSSLAEARAALGWTLIADEQYAAAEAELKRAIAIDPHVPRGHEGLARLYMYLERPAEQLAAAKIGEERDPFSQAAIRELALALMVNGNCDEALRRLLPLKYLDPPAGVAGVVRGQCYVQKKMWREAIAEFRWATEKTPAAAALAFLGYALARSGARDEATVILSDLLAGRKQSHGAFGIAAIYAGLGDFDNAFSWLDKAVAEGTMRIYIFGPLFDDLRRDPRFERLKREMRIPSN